MQPQQFQDNVSVVVFVLLLFFTVFEELFRCVVALFQTPSSPLTGRYLMMPVLLDCERKDCAPSLQK